MGEGQGDGPDFEVKGAIKSSVVVGNEGEGRIAWVGVDLFKCLS